MKTLLYAVIFISSVEASTPKKVNRWQELMNLVNQEMRILEHTTRKGPELQYRMLELHSEKLKLIHEKNNKAFLDAATTANVNNDKESYFTESRRYYDLTKEFGKKLLKAFPESTRRAEVLFAMALNSRDYGRDNITEKFLLETISLVRDPHHSLRHHAETALADFYYNEKRYQDAITYYERVIKKTEDDWLPKHYFNVSWCYLKVREFDKAIKAIREAYTLTKNKVYVNIKDQVLDNVGSFYVYAGRPMEGLDFYLKNEQDPIPYLMPMAAKTSEKGHSKETESILEAAQNIIDKNEWFKYQEQLFHSYLDFYRQYNRFADHEEVSRKLVAYYKKAESHKELKLKSDLKNDSIEKMRSTAGYLQVKLAKDMKEEGGSYKQDEINIVLNYFNHLIALDPTRKVEYLYFRGETYYSVRRFHEAAPAYVECVTESKVVKKPEFARKALNSLLALTGMEVIEAKLNKKYLTYAYSEHVEIWPRDEKSEKIYPKLFEVYRHDGQDVEAAQVLRIFNKAYPEHLKDQQVLMTKVLDMFIEKKDTKKLASWVFEFKNGFLSFSRETIEKTEITLGNMLFMEYQELAKQGKKEEAALGFETIYANKLYTNKVKGQSAFFAALTYLELAETEKSYHWQAIAYTKMTEEEKFAKRDEQLKMAERSYKLQDFKTAYKISEFLLKKFCSLKDGTQNRFYEIAIMTALVEDNTSGAENVIREHSECLKKPESRDVALNQLYAHLEKKGDFPRLRLFVSRYEVFKAQYRFTLQKWYWEKSSLNLKEQIKTEFKSYSNPEVITWLREMDEYQRAQRALENIKAVEIWDKPVFDGDAYNKSLEGYLVKVQSFKQNYQNLMSSTQVDLAILATRMFANLYHTIGDKIITVRPQGMAPEMYVQFKGAMKQVAGQFLNASRQYDKQLSKALKDKEALTWGSRSVASVEDIENPVFTFYTGLTMDKGRE